MNHPLLVGSRALPGIRNELIVNSDWDFVIRPETMNTILRRLSAAGVVKESWPDSGGKKRVVKRKDGKVLEFEVAWPGSTGEALLDIVENNHLVTGVYRELDVLADYEVVNVPHPGVIYALKLSHRYLKDSPHFLKTMQDIRKIRKMGYGYVPSKLSEWFRTRERETYSYGHPSLMQKKDDFFRKEDGFYVYDHDDIHRAVAFAIEPAYTYFQESGSEVMCSRELFEKTTEEVRIYSVVEEAMVLALERSQIPAIESGKRPPDPTWSFKKALEKVCTSITSGWWREYAWEHYDLALWIFQTKKDYVEKFYEQVRLGRVRPFKKEGA